MSLAEWSNTFGLFALCRESNMEYEYNEGLSNIDSIYSIIYGSKNSIHVSKTEVEYLFKNGFNKNLIISNSIKPYSLFENTEFTEKLLRILLTPRVAFKNTENEINAIFIRFHKSKLNIFENFVKYIGENACIWSIIKEEGFSCLNLDYINSKGNVLRQFEDMQNINYNIIKNIKTNSIYNDLSNVNKWYYKHIRQHQLYKNEKFRKLYDWKKYIIWKWAAYWLPLSINEDIKNIFDMNKYLIENVSNKLKVRLNAIDTIEILGIHVCQIIPDTLKYIFNHVLNLSSPVFTAYRKIIPISLDQWRFNHSDIIGIYKIYGKLQKNWSYFKNTNNLWFIQYLKTALKLDNNTFKEYMDGNNLINAYNKQITEQTNKIFTIEQTWDEYKLKTIYKLVNIIFD